MTSNDTKNTVTEQAVAANAGSESVDEPAASVEPAADAAPEAATATEPAAPVPSESHEIVPSESSDEDVDSEDSLTFSNGVIEKIVALAMRDVPGVVGMKGSWFNRVQDAFGATDTTKGVTVEVTPESAVRVNISVLIKYGAYAPQVFEDVKRAVVKQVTGMTGLDVAGVNLRIEDVLTPEEYEGSKRGGKDKGKDKGASKAADKDGENPAEAAPEGE